MDYNTYGRTSALKRVSISSPFETLGKAQVDAEIDKQNTQSALLTLQSKYQALDTSLEGKYKDGARAILAKDPQMQTQLTNYQNEAKAAKDAFESAKKQAASLQSGRTTPQDAESTIVEPAKKALAAADAKINNLNTQIKMEADQADDQLQSLAQTRDQMSETINKLKTQMTTLQSEADTVQGYIDQKMQMAQMQGQPQGGPNANKIAGGVSGGGSPKGSSRGGFGAAATGQPARGTLSALPASTK